MKKFLVVLTILVLVAGFAFAAVTGYVEAKYTFDFTGTKLLTYDINGKHSKVSFSVSTEQAKVNGSNKPYATVTVDVELSAEFDELEDRLEYADGYAWADDFDIDSFAFGVVLSDFRIVGENWEIDFLKAVGVGDYAKSAWEVGGYKDGKKTNAALDAAWSFGKSKGITVTYDGYKIGVSAERREADKAKIALRAESKELTLAEGVTGQVAFGIGASEKAGEDMSFDFGISAKAAYATDDVTVNGAVDLQNVGEVLSVDVAAKVAVKPVTVDAYYANKVKDTSYRYFFDSVDDILSVRVALALDPVTVTVYGENLLNDDRILAVKEEGKFGALTEDAQFGIMPSLGSEDIKAGLWFANAGVGYDVQENLNVNAHVGYERLYVKYDDHKAHLSGLAFQAGAEYKLEKVTLTADAYVGKMFAESVVGKESSDLYFATVIGAESDSLVENAVLSATLYLDKNGVVDLYDSTRAVDSYSKTTNPYDFGDGSMYFQVGCKVAF